MTKNLGSSNLKSNFIAHRAALRKNDVFEKKPEKLFSLHKIYDAS